MIAKFNDYVKSLARSSMPSELKYQLEINNTELLRGHHMTKHVYETILARLRLIVWILSTYLMNSMILMPS